jgi:hypothetical protein
VRTAGYLAAPSSTWLFLSEEFASIADVYSALHIPGVGGPELEKAGCLDQLAWIVGTAREDPDGLLFVDEVSEIWINSKSWGRRRCWPQDAVGGK